MSNEQKGYTKEKADRRIKQREDMAREYEKQAKDAEEYETFDKQHSNDLREKARMERRKADSLRALKKDWGD